MPVSGIRRIHEIALTLPDVIGLAVGEPDVAVAQHVLDAGSGAWLADDTNYTANAGILPLRKAIAEKVRRDNGIEAGADQIWVTNGATQAIYFALTLLLGPGDGVLVPDPGYTTFSMSVRALHATVQPYPLRGEHDFLPTVADLEAAVTPETRVIILNSPSNPLGAVFPADTVRELLDFAARHDLWVLSDEVYEAFTYGLPHISPASLPGGERVITVCSLSKTYALTGARLGYLVLPPGDTTVLGALQEAMISCLNSPAQRAAIAAVTGPQDAVVAAREHYRRNLNAATALLDAAGIRYLVPRGAFYLWIDVSYATAGDVAGWAERFLIEQRVSVAPGSAFGVRGEGWIRVCVAASRDTLLEGLGRLPKP